MCHPTIIVLNDDIDYRYKIFRAETAAALQHDCEKYTTSRKTGPSSRVPGKRTITEVLPSVPTASEVGRLGERVQRQTHIIQVEDAVWSFTTATKIAKCKYLWSERPLMRLNATAFNAAAFDHTKRIAQIVVLIFLMFIFLMSITPIALEVLSPTGCTSNVCVMFMYMLRSSH